jgi:aminopeptidase N
LLFDEQLSDSKYKIRVAYVVAHELAHQWFGNLVTMEWWNSLWYTTDPFGSSDSG